MSPTFSLSCNPLGHGPTLSCKSKVCRKLAELPHTAVNARSHTFLQIIWHGNRHSRCLQGISARAMAPICVHRAPRTPPDIAPGHIRSRDVLQEGLRPATHSRQSPDPHVPAIHLARNRHSRGLQGTSARAMAPICVHRAPRTPLDIAPGHIGSRDGLQEDHRPTTDLPHTAVRARLEPCPTLSCNSSGTAIAIPRASRAFRLARWFAGRTLTCHAQPSAPGPTRSCNSPGTAIAILGAYRAHQLARWHRFVSIERPEPLQTSLQGISARAMVCRKITDLPRTCHTRPSEPG